MKKPPFIHAERVVAGDGVEPSTFRFSVGGSTVSVLHSESVCQAISSQSSIYVAL